MNKGGKPKHSYWTEGGFSQKRNCKGKLIAQCKVCNKNLQNTAINRLKDHRKECRYDESSPDTPDPDSPEPESPDGPDQDHADGDGICNKIARKEDNQDHAYAIHEDQQLSVNPQFLQTCKKGAAGTSEIKKRQTKVKSFVDNVTSSERRKIDKALLYFFVASKLDFKEMDSVYFKDFLNVIRPAYAVPTVPSINHMLNDVLNEAHEKVFTTDSFKSKLVPVLLLLKMDESTTIGLLRNVENKYVFVDVNKCTESNECELRLNLDMFIRECIKYTYENMNMKIHTIVHNLEVTMSDKISVNLDLENTETEILIFQCHTQYIRSIQKLLIRPELITKVNKLLGAFKGIESRIINLGGKNIVLYNSDSWDNYRAALESCSKNLKSMREIVGQSFKVATDILQLIFDDFFEQEIKELIEFSLEIENLKSKLLDIQCNIADALQYWLQLNESNKNVRYTDILNNVLKSVVSPVNLASNYLNPKYKGRVFIENDKYAPYGYMVEEFFVDNLSGEGMIQYTKYVSQVEIFSKLFEKNVDDVMVFWTVAERKYGELAKLAQKLLQIPACVPCVNMNKMTQNNLTQDQQEKIKCLFYTLKLNESAN